MDERAAYRGSTEERVRYGGNGNGNDTDTGGVAHELSETASAAVEGAKEAGAEAIDVVDEYLHPLGLSLKERPVLTLGAVAGVAVALGALWTLKRQQNPSKLGQLTNQLQGVLDQINRSYARWR